MSWVRFLFALLYYAAPLRSFRLSAIASVSVQRDSVPFKPDVYLAEKYLKDGDMDWEIINEELDECKDDRVADTPDPVDMVINEEIDSEHVVRHFKDYIFGGNFAGKQGPFMVGDEHKLWNFLYSPWNGGHHQYWKWVWQAGEDGMCDPKNPNLWVVWRGCKHTVAAMAPDGTKDGKLVCGAGSGKLHFSPSRSRTYLCLNDKSGHYKPNIKKLESQGLEVAWHHALENFQHLSIDEIVLRKKKGGGTATNSSGSWSDVSMSNLEEGVSGACFLKKTESELRAEDAAWNEKLNSNAVTRSVSYQLDFE